MNKFVVVTYYTKNTSYEIEVNRLIESLNQFDVDHDIRAIQSFGSWQKNTMFKAEFIADMLKQHSSQPIVWLDVDSILMRYPALFEMIDTDAAFYYRTNGGLAPRLPDHVELLSGTMYFKPTDASKDLIDMWVSENKRNPMRLEQQNLQYIIQEWRKCGGTLTCLPQTYCRIFDAQEDHKVIVHNQASRRFRGEIDSIGAQCETPA